MEIPRLFESNLNSILLLMLFCNWRRNKLIIINYTNFYQIADRATGKKFLSKQIFATTIRVTRKFFLRFSPDAILCITHLMENVISWWHFSVSDAFRGCLNSDWPLCLCLILFRNLNFIYLINLCLNVHICPSLLIFHSYTIYI